MSYDEFYVKSVIRSLQDWPEPGVTFRDVTPIFKDPKAMRMVSDAFIQRYIDSDITHIACIDARGFLFGAIMAHQLNLPLVLVRKRASCPAKQFIRNTRSNMAQLPLKCRSIPLRRVTAFCCLMI